jgi:hypothetical protein
MDGNSALNSTTYPANKDRIASLDRGALSKIVVAVGPKLAREARARTTEWTWIVGLDIAEWRGGFHA